MWQSFTSTEPINGTSSMGPNSALNRAGPAVPANEMLTGYELSLQLLLGGSGTTYNTIPTNSLSHVLNWAYAVSWIPTGVTPPSLGTNPDDSHFLMVGYLNDAFDRQTINQNGSPAYADLWNWSFRRSGRVQILTGAGGTLYLHIWNQSTATAFTGWEGIFRAHYADIN